MNPISRFASFVLLLAGGAFAAQAKSVVFWASDSLEPGNAVLWYGGGLAGVREVKVWRLDDQPVPPAAAELPVPASAVTQPALQPADGSLKFLLPDTFTPGVYAAQAPGGAPVVLNRPQLWFLQPTRLAPGLRENQSAPGASVQIVGKDFLLPGNKGTPRLALKPLKGIAAWRLFEPSKREKFSLIASLPADLGEGPYELRVSNGFGGSAGWSESLFIEIKRPDAWPADVFDVKKFGAMGDDVTDDTAAVRAALAAADKNGGGVVYFPWGTYRLKDWICIPEHTTLRGDERDATLLKWPVDEPTALTDFLPTVVYAAPPCAVENLTFLARKVNCTFTVIGDGRGLPPELRPKVKPWGATHDFFLRHVAFHHWLLAGHPERNAELWAKKYGGDIWNLQCRGATNLEVSDCLFQGGNQFFMNTRNSRLTNNSFSNEMGYCWTCLGGGAHYAVAEGNDLRASSSWGYGHSGMKYIYSAHNVSRNFVRGEREAMTLDISALPTARPVSAYWGTPIEVGNTPGNVFLRFPKPSASANLDGYQTGFVPNCFKDGSVTFHAYMSGTVNVPGSNQSGKILRNTPDTLFLDAPWPKPPGTEPQRLYLEVAPRGAGSSASDAWFGNPVQVGPTTLTFSGTTWIPEEFVDKTVLILDGAGTGQYRTILHNSENQLTLDRPWDVPPDTASSIGIWSLMRHMIVAESEGYDTSAFAQLYGSFYDYNVDHCRMDRNQGVWGQSGWFVQFRYNDVRYGFSYHKGIGPRGPTPEGNVPYSFMGLDGGNLRIGKFGVTQYGIPGNKPFFLKDALGHTLPGVRGCIVKGNQLSYNQRIALRPGDNATQPGKPTDPVWMTDILIDNNRIAHSAVGIQIGQGIHRTLLTGNRFEDVKQPLLTGNPDRILTPEAKPAAAH